MILLEHVLVESSAVQSSDSLAHGGLVLFEVGIANEIFPRDINKT